jgi:hypothetical protein
MKKLLAILSITVIIVITCSCRNSNTKVNSIKSPLTNPVSDISKVLRNDKVDSIVSLIISISANDFIKNQQPAPVDFKNVKLRYIKKANGEELYILCGQFVTADKQETQFATIKNIDYEQLIGNNALTYCQTSQEIPYTKEDLSYALKNKFGSLKNLIDKK